MGGFELGEWDVVELAVQSPLVEPVDVGEGGQLDVLGVAPGALQSDELGLVEAVHALSEGIDAPIGQDTSSGGLFDGLSGAVVGHHALVDLAGEVALDAADDLAFGHAFGGAAGDVVDGRLVETHPHDR